MSKNVLPFAGRFSLAKSVLLVIDVQESFAARTESWARRANPNFERNLTALIDAYRAAERPIIYAMHEEDTGVFSPDSRSFRLMDCLHPLPSEPILHKRTISVFGSTDLATRLNRMGISEVVVTGIKTEQCCETTTRHGSDLGYQMYFVTEATQTVPIPHWAGGPELSGAEVVARTEYALANRFARIVTVADVLHALPAAPALAVS